MARRVESIELIIAAGGEMGGSGGKRGNGGRGGRELARKKRKKDRDVTSDQTGDVLRSSSSYPALSLNTRAV